MKELGTIFKHTLDNIIDGVLFIDRDYKIIFANKAAVQFFGRKEEDVLNNDCNELYSKNSSVQEESPTLKCPCVDVFNSGVSTSVISSYITADGEEMIFHITAAPILDEKGEVAQILEILRDVTEEKRAEEILSESEEKYRLLLNNIDDIVYSVDIRGSMYEGITTFVSNQIENITGYTPDEFMKDPALWLKLIHPDDIPSMEKDTNTVITKKERVTRVYRVRHKDTGLYVWLEDKVSPRMDSDGAVVGFFSVARDVTERKTIEEKLKSASEKVEREKIKSEAIVSSIGDALGIVDTEFRIVYQNEISKTMFGDYVGQYCYKAYRQRDEVCDGCPVFIAMKDGSIQRVERIANLKNENRHLEITVSPLKDAAGNIIGGVEVVRDITDRKLSEDEIFHYSERLRLLREIDHAILTAQSTEKIVHVTLDHLKELVPCSLASIVSFDFSEREAHEIAVYSKDKPKIHKGSDIALGKYDLKEGLYFGDINVVEDLSVVPNPSDIERSLIEKGVRSYISIPIIHLDELMGSINIGRDKPSAFTPENVTVASEVADLLAVAIQSGRTDKELRESEKKYRDLVDTALVGVYRTSLSGEIIYVNNAMAKMLEFNSPEEMMEDGVVAKYKKPRDRERLLQLLEADGSVMDFEVELVTKNGKSLNVLMSSRIKDGFLSGMIMDISKLREAEKAVKESEMFLTSVLEGIKDGVVVLNKDYRILFANSGYAEQIHSRSEDIKGKFCHEVSYKRNEPCFLSGKECIVKEVFDSGISSRDIRRKGDRYMEMTVYPLKDAGGTVVSVVEIRRDVTRNIVLDEEIKERIRELEDFYDMAVGRELKMKSLKEEIDELQQQLKKR